MFVSNVETGAVVDVAATVVLADWLDTEDIVVIRDDWFNTEEVEDFMDMPVC